MYRNKILIKNVYCYICKVFILHIYKLSILSKVDHMCAMVCSHYAF